MTDKNSQRLFVLDTNVLMHDPAALFRFQEHDIYIPMVVLEELDAAKKGCLNCHGMCARPAVSLMILLVTQILTGSAWD